MSGWLAVEVHRKRKQDFQRRPRVSAHYSGHGNFAPSPGVLPLQTPTAKTVRRELAKLLGRHPALMAMRMLMTPTQLYEPPTPGEKVPDPALGWYESARCNNWGVPEGLYCPDHYAVNNSTSEGSHNGFVNSCLSGQAGGCSPVWGTPITPSFLIPVVRCIVRARVQAPPGVPSARLIQAYSRPNGGTWTWLDLPGRPSRAPLQPRPVRTPLEVDYPWYDPAVTPPTQPMPVVPNPPYWRVIPGRPDALPNRPPRERTERGNRPPRQVVEVETDIVVEPAPADAPLPGRPRRGEREVKLSFR